MFLYTELRFEELGAGADVGMYSSSSSSSSSEEEKIEDDDERVATFVLLMEEELEAFLLGREIRRGVVVVGAGVDCITTSR